MSRQKVSTSLNDEMRQAKREPESSLHGALTQMELKDACEGVQALGSLPAGSSNGPEQKNSHAEGFQHSPKNN